MSAQTKSEMDDLSDDMAGRAADLAAQWQQRAIGSASPAEKAQQKKMQAVFGRPRDKALLAALIDQSFRSADPRRAADQVHHLLRTHGFPEFFSSSEKMLLQAFMGIGRHLPAVSIPQFMARIRQYAAGLVISGQGQELDDYLSHQQARGVRINLNRLGEAVLGEQEAARRMNIYQNDLQNPAVQDISIKISTIYSQIKPLAMEHDCRIIAERLAQLFRQAMRHPFKRPDGTPVPKMIHLDMEAYADLELTAEAFRQALEQPDLRACPAGLALQAYLPDSFPIQQEITRWAQARTAGGGAPIKIRIVKGANMAMEKIEAALSGWPLAPFDNKPDVDANYKRMVRYGVQPEHNSAVRIGVASHNLFDLAYALLSARTAGTEHGLIFEMLAGMADPVQRVLIEEGLPLLVYTPVAAPADFINAVAYLFRRLDENTGPDNFLRQALLKDLRDGSWQGLRQAFFASCRQSTQTPTNSHRSQNRLNPEVRFPTITETALFQNAPDTDWSLPANRQWAEQIRSSWRRAPGNSPVHIPPVRIPLIVAGDAVHSADVVDISDPNQLPQQVHLARCSLAGPEHIRQAICAGRADPDGWRSLPADRRRTTLERVAAALEQSRATLIGSAAANTGKIFSEADAEVSEAVDLARYYPTSLAALDSRANLEIRGKGLGVVIAPWNFPIAIACGGILAALSAGNTVIFKPSSEALLTAWELCRVFWSCGISQSTLQFVPCRGSMAGRHLVGDRAVDFIILTGGTATALNILNQRPDLFLAAETGGKNATIVTAMADRDQAVKHVIYSAFGHSGQKCSATSLLILEKEVYDDSHFQAMLVDAAASLQVGSAWEFQNRLGPLIHPPQDALRQAIDNLEPGERWALQPAQKGDNPHLWTPGIKYGVRPGSLTHLTELFGPVLGVMRARNLKHAVEMANQTGYGLTAGLETLDEREMRQWRESIKAGNLYINRPTTGAITLRQPFGGMARSAVGPAVKTGGPNYVTQFIEVAEKGPPRIGAIQTGHRLLDLAQNWQLRCRWQRRSRWRPMDDIGPDLEKSAIAIFSYLEWAQKEFQQTTDYVHLRGEDNHQRYRPLTSVAVCVHPEDSLFETVARIAAGVICGCKVVLSIPEGLDNPALDFLIGGQAGPLLDGIDVRRQDEDQIIGMVDQTDRLRYAAAQRVPAAVYAAAAHAGRYIARAPVLMDGRLELLHYVVNQSISYAYHRYGNLGDRLNRG